MEENKNTEPSTKDVEVKMLEEIAQNFISQYTHNENEISLRNAERALTDFTNQQTNILISQLRELKSDFENFIEHDVYQSHIRRSGLSPILKKLTEIITNNEK